MKRIKVRFLFLAVVLVLSSCSASSQMSAKTLNLMANITAAPLTDAAVTDEFITASADMSLELFKNALDREKNSLISPTSVLLALAMTANGADGETLAQMEATLGGLSIDKLNEYLYAYVKGLSNEEKAKLAIANSIWIKDDDNFKVLDSFLQTNANYYGAAAYKADFSDLKTVDDINNWIKANTMNMVDDVLDQIPSDAVMYLVNAVAFDAEWKYQFNAKLNSEQTFTTYSGEEKPVEFMHNEDGNYLISGEKVTGVVRYYKGDKYKFVALMPDESIDLYDYINSLDGVTFVSIVKNVSTSATLNIPKFETTYTNELSDELKAMGMTDAFDVEKADLSKITGENNLYIGRVLHKAYIRVDEKGTKAGAATAVEILCKGIPQVISLNRPFVYAIVDSETNLPIFIGTQIDFE